MRTEEKALEPCPDGEYLCPAGRRILVVGYYYYLLGGKREEVLDLPESIQGYSCSSLGLTYYMYSR